MAEQPETPSLARIALFGRCPRCGVGRLFARHLEPARSCEACGLDYRFVDSGDGPAVFVILGLGAIIMMLVFWVEFRYEPPWWLHVLIWLPVTFGLATWMLRFLKALLVAQQYIHRSTALDE